ncbi:D-alanyl-D-alanine carboxypeptidase family protein [Cellulomonas chengniuliangii]|uniref:D-alanyl-D-alanine carboxypeptidase family protein n=1 Tax=Cellulomonas chengniuliangii TaxID=2968084 RepID=UPI001D0F422F|nr:D-alanyl-D-alanine carboxypeptidase family protein [Cellulomonas chengniuliangii]MCC2316813.1 D-alanyl-D-alanine carboxypeptidase family protein [Cellulomonas chengniuliangii]
MTLYVHGRRARSTRRRTFAVIAVLTLALTAGATVALLRAAASDAAEDAGGAVIEQDRIVATGSADPAPMDEGKAGTDPALAGVDAELARRVSSAQGAAAAEGVVVAITSAKRSAEEQQALVDAAITRYGSQEEASRWVLPPEASSHVTGLAVDVGPTEGALWLGEHGLDFGLCRAYANEMWHFEMLPEGTSTCPPMHEDSSGGW